MLDSCQHLVILALKIAKILVCMLQKWLTDPVYSLDVSLLPVRNTVSGMAEILICNHERRTNMTHLPAGGTSLLGPSAPEDVFTPEDCNDEHRMIADTVSQFVEERVLPRIDEIEEKKDGLMRELLAEAADLGLLGADIPEKYGGFETDEICSLVIAEKLGATGSFGTAQGVHSSIGSLPIVFFGNEHQKSTYLPPVVSGEKICAYALTEPDSGSDALSVKTRAVLSPDGNHYLLNGGKIFISNAGIADIFIVYAKVDGKKFSAFIVDADSTGLTIGPEEKKMGLKGSSTCAVYFGNVVVPSENLLYEVGKGHLVAFNILNIGRHKVSAQALGAAKYALALSAAYAGERKQFNQPLVKFGLIREKLGEMAMRIYAAESTVYRNGGLLMALIRSLGSAAVEGGEPAAASIEEYAVECSMEKIFVTEMESYVVDEGVQIHGGYGYITEYPVERLYRDSRVKRIFEGTNEINRLLVPSTLLRRGRGGRLALLEGVAAVKRKAAGEVPVRGNPGEIVEGLKEVFLFLLGACLERYGDELFSKQEILSRLADMAVQAYVSESSWLRAHKSLSAGGRGAVHRKNMATALVYTMAARTYSAAGEVGAAIAAGDEGDFAGMRQGVDKLLYYTPIDLISLRGEIAETVIAAQKYVS